MKINYLNQGMVKKSYRCSLLGHRFVETKKINNHFSEYECDVCRLQATNDYRGHKITLTSKLKDINETLFYLNLKKEFVARFYFSKKDR
ncbi:MULTISPECIES: hypothetical protein [Flavobacterium]|uniref:Uncharacterized protein n=1 Tax=Flavobacterium sedimenticola TaxID=3043286 RepID=A0ABT6XR75_9FLAO|nr:hypothetical protein [Flavobacterium sedimenticola]MDI9257589.1 hypothetical protein [Flavobacterium sedimenticola]